MSANRRILKETGHCPAGKQQGDTSFPALGFVRAGLWKGSTSQLILLLTLFLITFLPSVQEEQEPGAFSKESRSLKIEYET